MTTMAKVSCCCSSSSFSSRLLTILLLSAMCLYAHNSLHKFRQGRVATATFMEAHDDFVLFPSVTVCPGFRSDVLTDEEMGMDNASYPREAFLPSVYRSRPFSGMSTPQFLEEDPSLWTETHHALEGGVCQTVAPVPTRAGLDYSLYFWLTEPAGRTDGEGGDCGGGLDGSTPASASPTCRLSVFLHSEGAFVYRQNEAWFAGQVRIEPEMGRVVDLALTKTTVRKMDRPGQRCDEDADMLGWKRCVRDAIVSCDLEADPALCRYDRRLDGFYLMTDSWSVLAGKSNCTPPCRYEEYRARRLHNGVRVDAGGLVKLYYEDMVTTVTEEYLAFDLLSLVGEVGGALGLLLGWSCLHLAQGLFFAAASVVAKKESAGRKRRRLKSVDATESSGSNSKYSVN